MEDHPTFDVRKVLKNPFIKPKGSENEEPTGFIVQSDADKITVGMPCYIWFPCELVDLVQAHTLMTSKYFGSKVDVHHPSTLLFLNSKGNQLKSIECKHFKDFIGLPIVAYDFRRSLSTFCFESKNESIRKSEPSVLRHRAETGYAYYYQKHSENVEYVNIQYALKHGLVKANEEDIDQHFNEIRANAADEEWEMSQKRSDMAIKYSQEILEKEQNKMIESQVKTGKRWILPHEYSSVIIGIMTALSTSDDDKTSPFAHLKYYSPLEPGAGCFPPNSIWWRDFCRVLFGLEGKLGDEMRRSELSVYDGVPFCLTSGRKKVADKVGAEKYKVIGCYWRDKIREETKSLIRQNVEAPRFIFNEADLKYYLSKVESL